MISEYGSINGISEQNGWQEIQPDEFNDWLNQRDPNFDNYISLGDKKDKDAVTVFDNYSLGLGTNRDAWVYNFSHKDLEKNMEAMIGCYNSEVQRFKEALDRGLSLNINDFIEKDETKISWSSSLVPKVEKGILAKFNPDKIVIGVYRPFSSYKFIGKHCPLEIISKSGISFVTNAENSLVAPRPVTLIV